MKEDLAEKNRSGPQLISRSEFATDQRSKLRGVLRDLSNQIGQYPTATHQLESKVDEVYWKLPYDARNQYGAKNEIRRLLREQLEKNDTQIRSQVDKAFREMIGGSLCVCALSDI